jgi:hypothetical protein
VTEITFRLEFGWTVRMALPVGGVHALFQMSLTLERIERSSGRGPANTFSAIYCALKFMVICVWTSTGSPSR